MLLNLLVLVLSLSTTLLHAISEEHCFVACSSKPCKRPSGKRPKPCMRPEGLNVSSSSTNWSGYVAAQNIAKPVPYTVTVVAGSWIVPNIQAMGQDTWCSMWVGIDGAGSPTVEQIGTEHDIKNGIQSHYAWYEMFPLGSQEIVGFPVAVGDQISASVAYIPLNGNILQPNSDLFILQIFNNTKKLYTSIPVITSSRMQRLCAEWIVEAPWLNKTLPLSNFAIASMFNCACIINNIAGSINNPAWQFESMDMIDTNGALKASTSPLSPDGKSFSVSWKHS